MLKGNSNSGIRTECAVSDVFSLRTTIKKDTVSDVMLCNRLACSEPSMTFIERAGFPWKSHIVVKWELPFRSESYTHSQTHAVPFLQGKRTNTKRKIDSFG